MKFRNYCIVIMGNTKGVLVEINKISETAPNLLDSKGILIATFSSVVEPKELTDYFKSNGRNFFLFDLNTENSGVHMTRIDIHEGLFGFLKLMDDDNLKQKSEDLIRELSSSTVTNKALHILPKKIENKTDISIDEIDKLSLESRNNLMNQIIDKGIGNLSEYDKEILLKLTN